MKSFRKILTWLKPFIVYPIFALIIILVCVWSLSQILLEPSNDRHWNDDQDTLAYAEISENIVSIKNVRNFTYASTTSYTKNYYDKTFDLNKIKKVWYVIEPFEGIPGSAHTFLSFEFENNNFVSISVEIRKEKGEEYNPIKGLFNQYELMYVVGDEKDLIKLRSNYRKDLVFVYPINSTKEKVRELFLDMIKRVNQLKDYPEFYNSILNNCTSNIVKHVDKITPNKVPFWDLRVLLPEKSDELAYGLGLIDTKLTLEEARKRFFVNDKAEKFANDPNFSVKIRE